MGEGEEVGWPTRLSGNESAQTSAAHKLNKAKAGFPKNKRGGELGVRSGNSKREAGRVIGRS